MLFRAASQAYRQAIISECSRDWGLRMGCAALEHRILGTMHRSKHISAFLLHSHIGWQLPCANAPALRAAACTQPARRSARWLATLVRQRPRNTAMSVLCHRPAASQPAHPRAWPTLLCCRRHQGGNDGGGRQRGAVSCGQAADSAGGGDDTGAGAWGHVAGDREGRQDQGQGRGRGNFGPYVGGRRWLVDWRTRAEGGHLGTLVVWHRRRGSCWVGDVVQANSSRARRAYCMQTGPCGEEAWRGRSD